MSVEVRFVDNSKGKGLFAKKDFKKDAVIFEEDPLVCCQFSWNAFCKYKACDHCLRPLETAQENVRRLTNNISIMLPYPECCTTDKSSIALCDACGVEYCSLECLNKAFGLYHKTLCLQTRERNKDHPLERLEEAWKSMHYPPETSSIMLIVRLLAMIKQSPNVEEIISHVLQFCHRTKNEDAELAHKFLGDKFENDRQILYNHLLKCFDPSGIEQFLTLDGFQSLLALIGTNGQGVGTSAFSQWVTRASEQTLSNYHEEELERIINDIYQEMSDNSGHFFDNEGVALYSLQSACNHSCVPNTSLNFLHNNSRLSLIAVRDIQAGEEITVCYLDVCAANRSRHSRQKILRENYLFICHCVKCELQMSDSDVTSDDEME